MKTTDYTLKVPLSTESGTISAVTIRRPKVKDIVAVDKVRVEAGELEAAITMLCCVTGMAKDTAMEMDAEDFTAISEMLTSFLPKPKQEPGQPSAQ